MGKQYQTVDVQASMSSVLGLAVPEQVTVALAEIAESAREGLLALAVGAGLQVVGTLMEESVVALAGPKGKHDPDRTAVRHGHERGSVTLGGRRVAVQRPRVRAADGSGELPVAAYQLFSQTEVLGRLALERMLGGLSTRRYPHGLEPVGTRAEQAASGTSKSAVSRRFVAMTETALAELLTRDLSALDLVCLMVDGVHFGEHTCVVALDAEAQLSTLARELDKTHPGGAASLREGLAETLTVLRLGVAPTLARTLHSTNPIESMISICREHAANVKRWQDGQRRCAGAPRGWPRPPSSSAASTASCTCRPCAPPWRPRSQGQLPHSRPRVRRWWKRPDDHRGRHRSSTELGTSSRARLHAQPAPAHRLRPRGA